MAEITLRKYHGLGNDYLIYDPNRNACELQERQVEALCRRNLGVGADGILYGPFFDGDKMRVRIFNPDGSEAEKSGNGIRIFSKYLKDMGYVTEESYVLHTKAGETRVTFLNEQGDLMRVDMGYPEFVAKEIPVVGFEGEIVNEAIFFGDNFYNATCVSLGNPNCVLMLEEVSQKKRCSLARMWKIPDIFRTVSTCSSVRCSTGKIFRSRSMSAARVIHTRREQEPVQRLPHRTRWDLSATV